MKAVAARPDEQARERAATWWFRAWSSLFLVLLALPWLLAAHALADWSWPGAQALLQGTVPDGWRLIRHWDVWYRVPLLLSFMASTLAWLRRRRLRTPDRRCSLRVIGLRLGLALASLALLLLATERLARVVDQVVAHPLVELPADDRAIADTLLGQLARVAAGTDFDQVIGESLARGDVEHARIHAAAADLAGRPLLPATREALAEATSWQATLLRSSWDALRGGVTGRGESLSGLAGALAVDLTPAGDLRDIAYELGVAERPDELVLGLSVVGLGLTAAAFLAPAQALPARFGKAMLKTTARFARVSAGVGADIRRLAARLIDLPAARRATAELDLAPATAARLVRPEVAGELGQVGAELYRIQRAAGTGAALGVLQQADRLADLPFYRRVGQVLGKNTEPVLGLLGKHTRQAFRVYRAGKRAWLTTGGWLAALAMSLGGLLLSLSGSAASHLLKRRIRRYAGGSMMILSWRPATLLTVCLLLLPAAARADDRPPPEAPSGRAAPTASVTAERQMIVTANPLATEAGRAVLARGGSAVDAMIAAQFVLNLVEPQSSGIGGGAFLLHWDAEAGELTSFDGRETAPAAATPERFLDADGQPMPFADAVAGGHSVGVPGTLALLELAHRLHGNLPWSDLLAPAIRLAEEGFAISPRLAGAIADSSTGLAEFADARAYFLKEGGTPHAAGSVLRNPAFTRTLRRIAAAGSAPFYQGAIGQEIVAAVASAARNPATLTMQDLAGYRVVLRDPVCRPYRVYRVCGMGPPSSGGIAVLQILGLLEHFDMAGLGPSADGMQVLAEASKLAFADRNLYLADSDFIRVPVRGLLDQAYLTARAQEIALDRSIAEAEAGNPPWREATLLAPDESDKLPGTSQLVVVDAAGNAVSMTTTIESGFGSRLMAGGFLLNNELTDFAFAPEENGRPVANRLEPGKRPRSSMAPTIVFDRAGLPILLIGSPGGSQIIGYVVQALVAILDWGMDPQAAVAMGHVLSRNGPVELEAGTEAAGFEAALRARGQEVQVKPLNSGLHAIRLGPLGLDSGVDPRREGAAAGD
jgi:gamma-glutamyltranspeptidase/glutathione hydrolase